MAKQKDESINAVPVVDIGTEEGMTLEESLAKIANYLALVREPKVLSELSDREVTLCASLYVVAEKLDDDMLRNFLTSFLMLRVSKERKGRHELLDIARSARDQNEGRMSRIKSLFMGGGR